MSSNRVPGFVLNFIAYTHIILSDTAVACSLSQKFEISNDHLRDVFGPTNGEMPEGVPNGSSA